MTLLELFQIAIPLLTGIVTILKLITNRNATDRGARKRKRILITGSRPITIRENPTAATRTATPGRFDHCDYIDI